MPVAPEPGPATTFCSTRVLLPPAPPSICPVGAKLRLMPSTPSRFNPRLPPALTFDPVTAVKVLVLLVPIDTLPLMVPALMKVLPAAELSNAVRPVMVPVLVKLIWLPPYAAITGASDPSSETPSRAEEPMVPELAMLVVPPPPLRTDKAMPVRSARLRPSRPVVPFIVPWLLTVTVLPGIAVPRLGLPITVPEDSRLSRPSREGSMVPALLRVVPLPVSDIAVPPRPSSTPVEPPETTLTVRLLAPLAYEGASGLAAPEQVTVAPLVGLTGEQAAMADSTGTAVQAARQHSASRRRAGKRRDASTDDAAALQPGTSSEATCSACKAWFQTSR